MAETDMTAVETNEVDTSTKPVLSLPKGSAQDWYRLDAKDSRQANGRPIIDIEALIERVWIDLQGLVPRTVIEPEIIFAYQCGLQGAIVKSRLQNRPRNNPWDNLRLL